MSFLPGYFPGGKQTTPRSISYLSGANNLNNLSTYTYSSVAIGAAATGRQIFVSAMVQSGATLLSATIGGVAATILGQAGGNIAIIGAAVPSGTTATIVLNYSAGVNRSSIHVFSGAGFSLTPFATATNVTTTNPKVMSIDVPDGGCVIGAVNINAFSGTSNASWSGLTFDQNTAVEQVQSTLVSAHSNLLPAQTGKSVTITSATTPSLAFDGVLVALTPL